MFGADPKCVIIDRISQDFGKQESTLQLTVYDTEEAKLKIEAKYKIAKDEGKKEEKKEEAVKEADKNG